MPPRMNVGKDFLAPQFTGDPAGMDGFQKMEIARRMNRGARGRAEILRRDNLVPGLFQAADKRLRPR